MLTAHSERPAARGSPSSPWRYGTAQHSNATHSSYLLHSLARLQESSDSSVNGGEGSRILLMWMTAYIYSGGERKEWDGRRLKYKKVLQCNILYSISSLDPSIINTWRIGDWVTSHSFSLLSQNLMKHKLCIFCFRPESTACTSCRRHYLASRGRKMHSSERADISLKHHSYARVHVLC